MLPKLELSGNFYRFILSTGLVLVAGGFALPWLLVRNTDILLRPRSELDQLTPEARKTIGDIQEQQAWLIHHYLWFSVPMWALGVALVVYGTFKWRQRQFIYDAREEAERDKAILDAHPQSLREVQEAITRDVDEILEEHERESEEEADVIPEPDLQGVEEPDTGPTTDWAPENARHILSERIVLTQKRIEGSLARAFSGTHEVLSEMKLAGQDLDILLMPHAIQRRMDKDPRVQAIAEQELLEGESCILVVEVKLLTSVETLRLRESGPLVVKRLNDVTLKFAERVRKIRSVHFGPPDVQGLVIFVQQEGARPSELSDLSVGQEYGIAAITGSPLTIEACPPSMLRDYITRQFH